MLYVRIPPMKMEIAPRLLQSEPMQRCKLHNCRAACCLYGVWIDKKEVEILLENADYIAPHMPPGKEVPAAWFDDRHDTDHFTISGRVRHSTVVDAPDHYGGTACVFLRNDHKCALQVASEASGHHSWLWKPFYCILHPLDLDEEGRITVDETDLMVTEEGSCLRPAPQPIPLLETFEEELRYFLGDQEYERLRRNL
jgi:Protein of unknown function (DUF3109)